MNSDQTVPREFDAVRGRVLWPGDAGFSEEIASFDRSVVHAPSVVVAAAAVSDVVAAVRWASAHGEKVRVQSTGHGALVPATGMLVTTRGLRHVTIDRDAKTATIQAGADWGDVVAAAAPHGLMPVTGSSTHVGATGYLLGGGLGPLVRSHGYSSDHLREATLVTADGRIGTVSASRDASLFWALRGGRDGLGIVTDVTVALRTQEPLYAGSLTFAAEHIERVLRSWLDWTATADPQVSTSVMVTHLPDLETLPPALRGRSGVALRFAYPGGLGEGERLAGPLRTIAPIEVDDLGVLPIAEVARIHNDPTEPITLWTRGRLLEGRGSEFADAFVERVASRSVSPFMMVELRHLGSVAAVDVPEGSSVAGRTASFCLNTVGVVRSEFDSAYPAAFDGLVEQLAAWMSAEGNLNFAGRPESHDEYARTWDAETYQRLRVIRGRHDPDGVFASLPWL